MSGTSKSTTYTNPSLRTKHDTHHRESRNFLAHGAWCCVESIEACTVGYPLLSVCE